MFRGRSRENRLRFPPTVETAAATTAAAAAAATSPLRHIYGTSLEFPKFQLRQHRDFFGINCGSLVSTQADRQPSIFECNTFVFMAQGGVFDTAKTDRRCNLSAASNIQSAIISSFQLSSE
jgi:hypothetical protein